MAATAKKSEKKKPGRKKGTTTEVRNSRRIVEQMDIIKEKVSHKAVNAMDVIIELMEDKDSPASIRKTSAEIVLKVHKSFYDVVNERSEHIVTDEDSPSRNTDKNGDVVFLDLSYDGAYDK